MTKYKLADSVHMRIVQIFQEAVIMGIDGADLLRQIELVYNENDAVLELSPEYQEIVKNSHEKYLSDIANLLPEIKS